MTPIEMILRGVALPLLIAAAGLGIAHFVPALRTRAAVAVAIAVAAGYLAGHWAVIGWPRRFPPLEARDLLPYLVAVLALIAALVRPAALALVARAAVSFALPWLSLRSYIEHTWTATTAALYVAGLGAAILILWTATHRAAETNRGASVPLCLTATAAATAVALGLSGTALFAQLGGVLAAACGATVVLAWIDRQIPTSGLVAVVIPTLAAMWITGHFYADMRPEVAGLLAVSPLALGLRGRLGPTRPARATILTTALSLIPLAIGLWLAWRSFEPIVPGKY